MFETEQLQIGNWVETRQNCLVLSAVVFTPPTRTRQDKTVLSCPCRRCKQAISRTDKEDKSVVVLAGAARSHTPVSVIYLHRGGIANNWETY